MGNQTETKQRRVIVSQPVDREARQAAKDAAKQSDTGGGFDWVTYGQRMYENGVAIGRAQMLNEIAAEDIAHLKRTRESLEQTRRITDAAKS